MANPQAPAVPPVVLCAGIAVVDFIFRVERFPTPGTKAPTREFLVTGGGCAVNAAIAIARLGGQARFAGPLGEGEHSARIGVAPERALLSSVCFGLIYVVGSLPGALAWFLYPLPRARLSGDFCARENGISPPH
jgi:hypothetical protein